MLCTTFCIYVFTFVSCVWRSATDRLVFHNIKTRGGNHIKYFWVVNGQQRATNKLFDLCSQHFPHSPRPQRIPFNLVSSFLCSSTQYVDSGRTINKFDIKTSWKTSERPFLFPFWNFLILELNDSQHCSDIAGQYEKVIDKPKVSALECKFSSHLS